MDWGKRSGVQPGASAATVCPPPQRPLGLDCPQGPPQQASPNVTAGPCRSSSGWGGGGANVKALQAGWAQICLPLSVFTHQRPVFGPRPPPLPHALCLWESFLSQGLAAKSSHRKSPLMLPPPVRTHHFPTLSVPPPPNRRPLRRPSTLQAELMSPSLHVPAEPQGGPHGTWGHRVPGSSPRSTTSGPWAGHTLALEL